MPKITAIIPAAGSGKRMGGDISKQYLSIGDRPIIIETLSVFQNSSIVDEIILISPTEELSFSKTLVEKYKIDKVSSVIEGGKERQDSIRNGLDSLKPSTEIVIVHDGVRPFITDQMIVESALAAREHGAALVAVPVKDTVKEVRGASVSRTVDRTHLWLAQTPQAFRHKIIREAYDNALDKGILGTDDASLVEAIGIDVKIIIGSYDNIKVTTSEDLIIAGAILKERKS